LTKHKSLVATYLQTNFDLFFTKYNDILVQSESYVTKRQSIKLLGEILLDRANYSVMTKYVESGEHLKIVMKLLRDDRRMINYEGFHVFKVRDADPLSSHVVRADISRYLWPTQTNPFLSSASSSAIARNC
jgi:calcium binding protein 39